VDDIALIARRLPNLKEFFIKLERAAKIIKETFEYHENLLEHMLYI
jgi:hypothetical protein